MKTKETLLQELAPRKFGKRGTIWSIILLFFIKNSTPIYLRSDRINIYISTQKGDKYALS